MFGYDNEIMSAARMLDDLIWTLAQDRIVGKKMSRRRHPDSSCTRRVGEEDFSEFFDMEISES